MHIKVTSKSFSKTPELVAEVRALFDTVTLRTATQGEMTPDELADFLADADGAVIGLDPVDDSVLARCPQLKVVAKYGVGLDNIDLDACRARGVTVGWQPGVNRRSVAELSLAAMLWLLRNLHLTVPALKRGQWIKDGGVQLSGRTVGIVGLGNAGRDLAVLLKAFGCRVLATDIADVGDWAAGHGVEVVVLETLLATSDVVSLHVPLTPLTRGMIDEAALRLMKPTAILINTARGKVVRQDDLKRALMQGWIGAAALDVYEEEPPTDLEFLGLPNLMCTPHIGGNAREAVLAMGRSAIAELRAALGGTGQ